MLVEIGDNKTETASLVEIASRSAHEVWDRKQAVQLRAEIDKMKAEIVDLKESFNNRLQKLSGLQKEVVDDDETSDVGRGWRRRRRRLLPPAPPPPQPTASAWCSLVQACSR